MQLGTGLLDGVVDGGLKLFVLHSVPQVLVERPQREPSPSALQRRRKLFGLIWQQE
jgi:hypothetical protein